MPREENWFLGLTILIPTTFAEGWLFNSILRWEEALRLYTEGRITKGQYTDLAVLSADYFFVPLSGIKNIESVLTIVDGKIVHGSEEFSSLMPELPPILPHWSPVKYFGSYYK